MYRNLSILIFSILAVFVVGFSPVPKLPALVATRTMSSQLASPFQTDTQPAIRITVEIPRPPASMQLYKLIATRAPVDFLNEKLEKAKLPTLKLDKQHYVVRSGDNKEEGLHAFIDLKSGDAEFVPNFSDVVKTAGNTAPLDSGRATGLAREAFRDQRFIPKDATELRLAETIPVSGGEGAHPAPDGTPVKTGKEARQMMTIVPAVRYAGGFRVYGLGSHAVVTLANDGTVIGAMRRWRMASAATSMKPLIKVENIRTEILRQLRPMVMSKGTKAVVDKVEIAYYDNNQNLLQPVYHFEATIQPAYKRISPVRVSGFIPIGRAQEPIPDLTKKMDAKAPVKAITPDKKLPGGGIGTAPTPDDITLGEYANRNWRNDNAYITMSYAFFNGLKFFNSIIPGMTPPVTRTQWYEAWPWEVVGSSSKFYMNAVNVAYTVPHGDWLINTTMSNNADLWYVGDIGTGGNPGFGAAAGGVLATWVIMSCEVIPSYYDRQNEAGGSNNGFDAFNAWWGVFQGMHNAIGFRTIMFYPDDNTNWAFGMVASLGCDVNAAWFQEVAAYHAGESTYMSQHLKGGPQVHYDRASTMIDGRDLGQSIFSVGAQTASGTLWNFWMGN
jgi:Family of unknown function (DUF6345)